jgi:lycopene cyclase domain-containing protein
MSYFEFLARFLGIPLVLLAGVALVDRRRRKALPQDLRAISPWRILLVLAGVAVLYTTPWDNYLVATGVWWYDPALVAGITFGWVPLEEYIFFVLETALAGLWTLALARRLPPGKDPAPERPGQRRLAVWALVPLWLWSVAVLALSWEPGIYAALLLAWALPPIAMQLGFGADLLWRYRRIVLPAILVPALYLSLADMVALGAGIWTIDPEQSFHWMIAGILPVEEAVFFLLTNTLIVFGTVLGLAAASQARLTRFAGLWNPILRFIYRQGAVFEFWRSQKSKSGAKRIYEATWKSESRENRNLSDS